MNHVVNFTPISALLDVPFNETIGCINRTTHVSTEEIMSIEFGAAFQDLREQAGITMTDLSRQTGLSRSHLYRLESGESATPSMETLNSLAAALGVEPEVLYDIAWATTGSAPDLPSIPTYFRTKYNFDEEQIASLQRAVSRITKRGSQTGPKLKKSR